MIYVHMLAFVDSTFALLDISLIKICSNSETMKIRLTHVCVRSRFNFALKRFFCKICGALLYYMHAIDT